MPVGPGDYVIPIDPSDGGPNRYVEHLRRKREIVNGDLMNRRGLGRARGVIVESAATWSVGKVVSAPATSASEAEIFGAIVVWPESVPHPVSKDPFTRRVTSAAAFRTMKNDFR
jgi:hypothetical protein